MVTENKIPLIAKGMVERHGKDGAVTRCIAHLEDANTTEEGQKFWADVLVEVDKHPQTEGASA